MAAQARRQKTAKKLVTVIPPESPEARDEGPRLIPLPDGDRHHTPGLPPLPTDGYVALADKAIRLWSKSAKVTKADSVSKTGTDR
jgi:hypothetical protein